MRGYYTPLHFIRKRSFFAISNTLIQNTFRSHQRLSHTTTVLWNVKSDSTNIFPLAKDSSEINIPSLLHRLDSLNKNCQTIAEISQDFVLPTCSENLSRFTDEELLNFLNLLRESSQKGAVNFKKNAIVHILMKKLDEECLKRSKTMDLQTVLVFLEKFCYIKENSSFLHETFVRTYSKIHNKPTPTIVHFVRIVNLTEHWIKGMCKPYEIQYYLEHNFDKLNIEQITHLTTALKQMTVPISSYELKHKLFLRFSEELCTMDEYCRINLLNSFCSIETFTINMKNLTPQFSHVLNIFNEKFDSFSLPSIACVSMLTTKFLLHHPEFLDKVYRRFLKEGSSSFRNTSIIVDYIVYSLIFFNFHLDNEDVYSNVLQIIETEPLKKHFYGTKRYVRLVCWLANAGVYKYDKTSQILDENFLRETYKTLTKFTLYPYPFVLDLGVQIECPNYTGNRLKPKVRNAITTSCYDWNLKHKSNRRPCYAHHYQFTDNSSQLDFQPVEDLPYCKILQEISSTMNSLFQVEFTHLCYVLPHMPRPNLLCCFDSDKYPQNISHLKDKPLVDWKLLDSDKKWSIVTVLINNSLLRDTMVLPMGDEIAKVRQFKALGFDVISVIQDQWLILNDDQKTHLCRTMIS